MEKPVYFLSDDPLNDPVVSTTTIPKLENVQEIKNAQKVFYKRRDASYLEQGRLGYLCSVFKLNFFSNQPVKWIPVSQQPRVLLMLLTKNDVNCQVSGQGDVNLRALSMSLMYLHDGREHVASFPAGHTEIVHINIEVSLLESLVPDFPPIKTLLNLLQQQSENGILASQLQLSNEICVQLNKILNYDGEESTFKLFMQARVIDILYEYTRRLSAPKEQAPKPCSFYDKILMAKQIVDAQEHERVTRRSMARKMGLSTHELQQGFSEIVGMTYDSYQIEMKMQRAAALLMDMEMSIGQVAERLGYDPSNFGKAFEKRFRCTPSAFRKKTFSDH